MEGLDVPHTPEPKTRWIKLGRAIACDQISELEIIRVRAGKALVRFVPLPGCRPSELTRKSQQG